MKTFKTTYRLVMAMAFLAATSIIANAQYLLPPAPPQVTIGSWQSAPIPPAPANDEGWFWASGGGANLGSIFASTNYGTLFELDTNVAAGYAQSLNVHETGYGNVRLAIVLSGAQYAAFTNNNTLNFTFSVPPGSTTLSGGYAQMVQFQYSPNGNYNGISPSTATGFSETGSTDENSSGQPVYDFWPTSPARSQVVSWYYGNLLTNFVSASYIQLVFVFQTGGNSANTNLYFNNVNLTGAGGQVAIVDQFDPTNNPYSGTNVYADFDEVTNVYNLWAGYGGNTAVDSTNIIWCATNDAYGSANSGSLELVANFSGANQFLVWNLGPGNTFPGINPPITNFVNGVSFDIMYDPSSPTVVNGTVTNYGFFELGEITASYSIDDLATYSYPITSNGWVHVSATLNPLSDPNLQSISTLVLKQYSGYYGQLNGTTKLWIDNIQFTYTNAPTVYPAPTIGIGKAIPGMRIFAGDPTGIYSREEVRSIQTGESWIGASTYPVSYTYKLLSYPSSIDQTHIFLIPLNDVSGGSSQGYNGLDYSDASNLVWMVLAPGPTAGSVVCSVQWKTNSAGANPNHTELAFTNATALGTWTLEFTSANGGQVIPPGGSAQPFTINDPNVSTDFANPLQTYFGLQPNSTAGVGQYEDWGFIAVSNTSDGNYSEDFSHESTDFNGNTSPAGYFDKSLSQVAAGLVISRTNADMYWFNWNTPNVNTTYLLGSNTNLTQANPTWINPAYYSGYNDENAPRGNPSQYGNNQWELLPIDDLPTTDGSQGGPVSPSAFFLATTNQISP